MGYLIKYDCGLTAGLSDRDIAIMLQIKDPSNRNPPFHNVVVVDFITGCTFVGRTISDSSSVRCHSRLNLLIVSNGFPCSSFFFGRAGESGAGALGDVVEE